MKVYAQTHGPEQPDVVWCAECRRHYRELDHEYAWPPCTCEPVPCPGPEAWEGRWLDRPVLTIPGAAERMAFSGSPTSKRGRPRAAFDLELARRLREGGLSWRAVAREVGVGTSTVRRALALGCTKNRGEPVPRPSARAD